MQVLVLHHLRGGTDEVDMSPPEGGPTEFAFLDSYNEELHGP